MSKKAVFLAVIGGIVILVLGLAAWDAQNNQTPQMGISYPRITMETENFTFIGTEGPPHFYCPTSEFYIHIGNATMLLHEVNGTIYIEGVKFIPPDTKVKEVSDYSVYNDNGVYKVYDRLYDDPPFWIENWLPDDDPVYESTNAAEAIQWAIDQGGP